MPFNRVPRKPLAPRPETGISARIHPVLFCILAGCAYSNQAILEEIETREAMPALEAAIDHGGAAPALGPLRETVLPMIPGRVPAVLGRLNGVEMPFALDTGTSVVTATAEAAREARLYLPARPTEAVGGPGHVSTNRLCAFASLELGPNRFGPGVATVPVDQEPHRWMGLGTDRHAIVGCSVLSHFAVTFDFRRKEVRLRPTGLPGYTENLMTTVVVNGKPFWLMVDSGATKVFLEPWAALELGLITEKRADRHDARGASLSDALFTPFTLDSVAFPPRVFRDVAGAVVKTFGWRGEGGARPAGLLGLAGFGDLVWTLDYGTKTLVLHP